MSRLNSKELNDNNIRWTVSETFASCLTRYCKGLIPSLLGITENSKFSCVYIYFEAEELIIAKQY